MKLTWTPPAKASLDAYIGWLHERNPGAAARARSGIRKSVGRLARHPFMGRPARWPGLREWSVLKWHKIAVYRVVADRVEVLALLDSRQDLSKADPTGGT